MSALLWGGSSHGDLILTEVGRIPPEARPVGVERLPHGGIPLGGGHVLYPGGKESDEDA